MVAQIHVFVVKVITLVWFVRVEHSFHYLLSAKRVHILANRTLNLLRYSWRVALESGVNEYITGCRVYDARSTHSTRLYDVGLQQ